MFNKLKWTIKKIFLFLFHPLVTIKHNFKYEIYCLNESIITFRKRTNVELGLRFTDEST